MSLEKHEERIRGDYQRGEVVLSIFKRGAEFTRQVLSENEVLHETLRDLTDRQQRAARDPEQWEKLRHEIKLEMTDFDLEDREDSSQPEEVETDHGSAVERFEKIEDESDRLVNLYVASSQLHSSLDASEVLKVIIEIVINLIGAEVFSLYVYDEETDCLEPVASEGRSLEAFSRIEVGCGVIGESVVTGEVAVGELACAGEESPVVCIPLRIGERLIGAIAIYKLLQHKPSFVSLDYELFTLLGGHAAIALFASRLDSQWKGEFGGIQGFIELLKQ